MKTTSIEITATSNTLGTCLQGYIEATREELTQVFGEPENGDGGYKSFHDWGVRIIRDDETSIIATIYDWKYDQIFPEDKKIKWNIGGRTSESVDAVTIAMLLKLKTTSFYLQAEYA
jgi:hypothetical protein